MGSFGVAHAGAIFTTSGRSFSSCGLVCARLLLSASQSHVTRRMDLGRNQGQLPSGPLAVVRTTLWIRMAERSFVDRPFITQTNSFHEAWKTTNVTRDAWPPGWRYEENADLCKVDTQSSSYEEMLISEKPSFRRKKGRGVYAQRVHKPRNFTANVSTEN